MDVIFVMCDPHYFVDAALRVNVAFKNEGVVAVTVSNREQLDNLLSVRKPTEGKTGILFGDNSVSSIGQDSYNGFPCARVEYAENGKLCDLGDCWNLPVGILRQGMYHHHHHNQS